MLGVNQVQIVGNVGQDPEAKKLPSSGTSVCNFSIAVNEKRNDKEGKAVESTEWVPVVAFGKLAEIAGEHVKKGSPVFIRGRLSTRSWKHKDHEDVTCYKTEVIADMIRFLPDGKNGGGSESPDGSDNS